MSLQRNKPFKSEAKGILYLVATPIGNISDVSKRAIEILSQADIVACEDTRNTGLLFSRLGIKPKRLVSCFAQKEQEEAVKLISKVHDEGLCLAYVSDAGTPGISDPGALLVNEAVNKGVSVSAIPGPAAFVQALIMSGFDTADFSFYGFLPAKASAREEMLKGLKDRKETLIFYEAPHRLFKTLDSLIKVFGPNRRACLARELTKIFEEYIRGTLKEISEIDPESVKGEFVIVVEKNKEAVETSDDNKDLIEKAKDMIELGNKKTDVARELAKSSSLSKNDIYKLIKDL